MIKAKRRNGFSRPFGYYQMLSWAFIIFEILFAPLFIVCVLRVGEIVICMKVICSSILVISFVFLIIFWIKVSVIDFSDNQKYDIQNGKLCNYCLGIVNFHCKHCKVCNKCVIKFDHHCNLLNTCIGEKNYKDFIFMLVSALVFHLNIVGFSLVNIIWYFFFESSFTGRNERYLNLVNLKAVIIINFSCSATGLIICLYIIFLLCFHWYLKYKNMTTYEYIIANKAKKATRVSTKDTNVNRTEIENVKVKPSN